jgi:tRNA threonylcarbamoyladenosine biosynthesis protein TsaE
MILRARTKSVEQTKELGRALAELVRPGDIILLAGDLGAGKTALTQGLGAAMGVLETITSPTFTIASSYEGRIRLHHLDVYRLEHLQEAIDLGLAELVDDGAVAVIEWGDAVAPALPPDFLEIRLQFGEGDDDRHLDLRTVGGRWAARADALRRAIEPWEDSI